MTAPPALEFLRNEFPTLGIELELMLLDARSLDLKPVAPGVCEQAAAGGLGDRVKLEITQSMIEINSSVHAGHASLRDELARIVRDLADAAHQHGALLSGAGTHPFHRWQERRISPSVRFHEVAHRYGYLAKQFTVFGQHIHVGCRDGDEAIRITRALARYVPQFIALAAASPFHRGVDTGFDSCRLNMVAAFPLSGRMPELATWSDFEAFLARLQRLGVVESIKDFYWDVRPKPETGTVELRVTDTPLDVGCAADLAAFAQAVVAWLREAPEPAPVDDYVYRHNRFQATRFGFDAQLIVGSIGERASVRDDILDTTERLAAPAAELGASDAIDRIARCAQQSVNGARWLREQLDTTQSLAEAMRAAARRWEDALPHTAVKPG